jgi:hypothetical protein
MGWLLGAMQAAVHQRPRDGYTAVGRAVAAACITAQHGQPAWRAATSHRFHCTHVSVGLICISSVMVVGDTMFLSLPPCCACVHVPCVGVWRLP